MGGLQCSILWFFGIKILELHKVMSQELEAEKVAVAMYSRCGKERQI